MNKTAMQELIQWMTQERFPLSEWVAVMEIKSKATELLDKEKEQLRHAFFCGDNSVFHYEQDYTEDFTSFDEYYQKTYNQ